MQVDNIHEKVKPHKYLLRLIISRVRDCWETHTHKYCRCVYLYSTFRRQSDIKAQNLYAFQQLLELIPKKH